MMLLLLALATEAAPAIEPPAVVTPPHNYLHAADPRPAGAQRRRAVTELHHRAQRRILITPIILAA